MSAWINNSFSPFGDKEKQNQNIYLKSFSEKMGAGSHHEPGVTQRNWFANAAGLIKISYSSWRVCFILEIVVSALSDPFLTHLLLIQDRERWMTRKQTVRPFIKIDFFPFAKGKKNPDFKNALVDLEEQKGHRFSPVSRRCLQIYFAISHLQRKSAWRYWDILTSLKAMMIEGHFPLHLVAL